ncbi:MAG: hypothetical protein OXD50_08905 [Chloroflexi bacterium]|nr:hypothetical protein [Chloroflexota bacterium]
MVGHRIGFLGIFAGDIGLSEYRGGLMVTDESGKPLEYRIAAWVRPNALVRAAYGSTLNEHVVAELIASPLMSQLEYKPRVVFVNDLMALDRDGAYATAHLTHQESVALIDEFDVQTLSSSANQPALSVIQYSSIPARDREEIVALLERARTQFDPYDVFSRIMKVHNIVAEEDARFS